MHQNLISLLPVLLSALTPAALACNTITGIKFTNYGYPDASGTPAYKCSGTKVIPTVKGDHTLLGDGSYNHPYAAAAASPAQSFLKECELIYIPLLKKYFRVQDNCSGCVNKQVDLYTIQENKNVGQTQCEWDFGDFNYGGTTQHEVVRDPPSGLPTDTAVLFQSGKCYNQVSQGRIFPGSDGHVSCPKKREVEVENSTVVEEEQEVVVGEEAAGEVPELKSVRSRRHWRVGSHLRHS